MDEKGEDCSNVSAETERLSLSIKRIITTFITNWGPVLFLFQSRAVSLLLSSLPRNPPAVKVPVNYLFEKFSLNFIEPLPKKERDNVNIFVALEAFSRWPMAVAAPSTEAKLVSRFLYKDIFSVLGLSTRIWTDNGSAFDNKFVKGLIGFVQVNPQFTSPYRPSLLTSNSALSMKGLCTNLHPPKFNYSHVKQSMAKGRLFRSIWPPFSPTTAGNYVSLNRPGISLIYEQSMGWLMRSRYGILQQLPRVPNEELHHT
ncbi:hypothetical protein [Parasitella parasitica]|uniref:Integrase catalytic domain-containing protein n=1 Tax=Parasitella parasitica TaxID=35722 RepID=A0A0B7NRJ2_9FUNG|nr:hypothetical protein [Parasitella parasitica]